jgi:uncharacterized protein YxeA
MKLKGLVIGGAALVLLILAGGFFFYDMNKTDDGASVARVQPKTDKNEEEKVDNRDSGKETSDQKNAPATEGQTSTTTTSAQNPVNPVDNIDEETGTTGENSTPSVPAVTEAPGSAADTPAASPDNKQTGGLYFATREEAVAFGFSRFTQEEIDLYNRASAKGLTPEQQEMAIQMAYSRFSAEEIAAIEEALNR